jgi:hypothetical protein
MDVDQKGCGKRRGYKDAVNGTKLLKGQHHVIYNWRGEPERRLEGQQFTKLGRKYQHDCMYVSPEYKI